jgi:hypothetical protein
MPNQKVETLWLPDFVERSRIGDGVKKAGKDCLCERRDDELTLDEVERIII